MKDKKKKGSSVKKKAEGSEEKSRYATMTGGIQIPYRYIPGVVAFRKIRRY